MLEFPGGRGIGGIKFWESMLELYVGNAGGVLEKGEGICNEVQKIIVADIENMGIWLPLGYNKGELG